MKPAIKVEVACYVDHTMHIHNIGILYSTVYIESSFNARILLFSIPQLCRLWSALKYARCVLEHSIYKISL
jgi:hypothetical protein